MFAEASILVKGDGVGSTGASFQDLKLGTWKVFAGPA